MASYDTQSFDITRLIEQYRGKKLEELYQGAFETFQQGKLVKGTVVNIDSDGVLVDIKDTIKYFDSIGIDAHSLYTQESTEYRIDRLADSVGIIIFTFLLPISF